MSLENRHSVQSYSCHMKLQISLKPSSVSVYWMTAGHKQHFYLFLIWTLKSNARFLPSSPHRIFQTQSATAQTHKLGEEDTVVVRMLQEGKRNPRDNLMSAGRVIGSLSFSLVSEGESRVCLSSVWNLLTRCRKILYSPHVFMLGKYPDQWLLGNSSACYLGTGGYLHCWSQLTFNCIP